MGIVEQVVLGFALAMDAFAVAICKGLAAQDKNKEAIEAGLWFGSFQAGMTILGYFLGSAFKNKIESIDHWIAFFLLGFLGISMIKDSFDKAEEGDACPVPRNNMLPMALATSIDALAIGITLSVLSYKITSPAIFIGVITFIMSYIGVKAGSILGEKYRHIAEFIGGIILILLGIKILIEHLYFI